MCAFAAIQLAHIFTVCVCLWPFIDCFIIFQHNFFLLNVLNDFREPIFFPSTKSVFFLIWWSIICVFDMTKNSTSMTNWIENTENIIDLLTRLLIYDRNKSTSATVFYVHATSSRWNGWNVDHKIEEFSTLSWGFLVFFRSFVRQLNICRIFYFRFLMQILRIEKRHMPLSTTSIRWYEFYIICI